MKDLLATSKIISKRFWFAAAFVVLVVGIATTVVLAVTPSFGGMVGGSTVFVDVSAGDQLDPHVSGDLAAYTDAADPAQAVIRYHDFLSPVVPNASIPLGADDVDTLSNVDSGHIAFARYNTATGIRACMVYDVASHTNIQIASAAQVGATALGGNTVAFVSGSPGEIMVGSISSPGALPINVSASANDDVSPAVSPAGNVITWSSCAGFSCSIMKSTRSGGVWSSPAVVRAAPAANPDTDGTYIVYDAAGDIFFQPVGGGGDTQLVIDGVQRNPSIAGGVIAFESATTAGVAADLFVYQIATNTLYRVTDTPFTDETLNDVTVLPNGDVRVVWAADDDSSQAFARNIYARTFSLPQSLPLPDPIVFTGFFQPVENPPVKNMASAGSAIPLRFSLGGDHGLSIFTVGYPASGQITCDASEPGSEVTETINAGGSSLSYDAATDQYTYIWKTDRRWRGTCRMLVLGLNDGSQHFAKFQFR
jgi:hypothetical protein